jgi:DNA-binding response OmpR family regulator
MISYGKRVLVVDDDERERQETALVLEQAGFAVVQACDGLHALSEMQKRRFDVVVTDCQMRHLNGLDFWRRVGSSGQTSRSSSSRRHGI